MKLAVRIILLPIKLVFQLLFRILQAFFETFSWVFFGGQEVIYGKDRGKSFSVIIEQNKELIKLLKKERNP